jgi:hypothetical protein
MLTPWPVSLNDQRRDALVLELRALVASFDHFDAESHRSTALASEIIDTITLLTTPLACAVTILAAAIWSPSTGYGVASVEVITCLMARKARRSRTVWRRWLGRVVIAVFVIAIA